jgi:hypothetical protein
MTSTTSRRCASSAWCAVAVAAALVLVVTGLGPSTAEGAPRRMPSSSVSSAGASAAASAAAVRVAAGPRACPAMRRPARPNHVWFSRPGLRGTAPIARHVAQLICSAARGARVDIALYYIRAGDPHVEAMLRSLRRMVKYRGVKVRILLEGKLYRRGSGLSSSLAPLRRFAQVVLCNRGCRSERRFVAGGPPAGIQHHKFVTINNMRWSPGADPVVVSSSGNWSESQLERHWQSAMMTYGDRRLFREFHMQWELMRTCAARTGCAGWSRRMQQLGLGNQYAVVSNTNVWHDARAALRSGDAGRGSQVLFSPYPGALDDPVAGSLQGYDCSAGGSVWVAHMFVTRARNAFLAALQDMQTAGCDVRIILSTSDASTSVEGRRLAQERGLPVVCVPHMHDKLVLVNAVRLDSGQRDHMLWSGSQSMGGNGLRKNDEAYIRLSVTEASGTAAAANQVVWNRYLAYWRTMRNHTAPCP